jgi:hypothetical protein
MTPSREDPAEQGSLRYYYRGWRPTRWGRITSRAYAWLTGLGLLPQVLLTLQMKSRTDGRLYSRILVVVTHEGRAISSRCWGTARNGYATFATD